MEVWLHLRLSVVLSEAPVESQGARRGPMPGRKLSQKRTRHVPTQRFGHGRLLKAAMRARRPIGRRRLLEDARPHHPSRPKLHAPWLLAARCSLALLHLSPRPMLVWMIVLHGRCSTV